MDNSTGHEEEDDRRDTNQISGLPFVFVVLFIVVAVGVPIALSISATFLKLSEEEAEKKSVREVRDDQRDRWISDFGLLWRLDPAFRVRENVFLFTRILEENGPEAKDALPAIIGQMKNKRWRVRGAAANLVALIGGDAALKAVPALREAMEDERSLVRLQAIRSLKALGQAVTTPRLEEPKSEP